MTNHEEHILMVFILGVIMVLFFWALADGIDRSIQNQDTMLCESAKVSGNVQYLHKCECYYQTNNIKCLQEEK